MEIFGIQLDAAGRCVHYHGTTDIAALKCADCQQFFACYNCHDALREHAFVASPKNDLAVMCGECQTLMNFASYTNGRCPVCQQVFNPKCAVHYDTYFVD
ncbi:CHY zinc finger protein [Periweissella ghanensis]|uniref:CHY-type domain-containing protein n=1 Tax=Periweissella ghanensis TaxID=467997 RepID=A0ABM8ZB16_9LACO|nr:CHY zinc finger protein [Periweissella ghanensis]CAH0418075.1 hypothetical protein WGH24286_00491 [Periweissella ghanensis]